MVIFFHIVSDSGDKFWTKEKTKSIDFDRSADYFEPP